MVATNISRKSPAAGRRVRRLLHLCRTLLTERGESAGLGLAAECVQGLSGLETAEWDGFVDGLARSFGPATEDVNAAARLHLERPGAETLLALLKVTEPPRQELFRRINRAPGATATLVKLREQVLARLPRRPALACVEFDLAHLLRSWFSRGFLEMRRIDWNSPAFLLEKIIAYEAVHEIQSWHHLRRRLQADRRCYAYFHPALPGEPLIFIEVALTSELSGEIAPLLDPSSAVLPTEQASHAIFYSITNCQPGLRGVSFGNFLIKQVAEDIARELPRVRRFATLSPVVGFAEWMQSRGGKPEDPAELKRACASYLLTAKRGREPLDPVARFHLGNGARLERVCTGADRSPAGQDRSWGCMVNYAYRLAQVEQNHEAYARAGTIACSEAVARLVAPAAEISVS